MVTTNVKDNTILHLVRLQNVPKYYFLPSDTHTCMYISTDISFLEDFLDVDPYSKCLKLFLRLKAIIND